ncbi:MAG: alpha/beta hydrolase, partial [Acidobacteriota bacterium]
AERLAEHVEVVVPDLPGWGRSAAAPVGVDAAFYVELLREMVDGLIGEPTLIVAAGLPAAYAVALATTHPDRVSGLGLIAPTGLGLHDRGARFVDRLLFRLTLVPVLGEAAMHLLTRRPALERHLRELTADSRPVDAVALEEIELNARRATTRGALAAFLTGRLDFDARPALRRLDGLGLPVWLGWGRRATRPPIEAADLWLRRLDSARLDVFEQAGSLPHAEAPAEVASRLVSWARASEAVGHRAGAS